MVRWMHIIVPFMMILISDCPVITYRMKVRTSLSFQIVDLGVDTPAIEDSDVDSSDDEAENNHLLNPFEGVIERLRENPELINFDSIFLICLSNK